MLWQLQQKQSINPSSSHTPSLSKSISPFQPTPPQDTLSLAVNLNSELNTEIKKIRREYQTRILQLQNQVKYLKEDVDYKQQAHEREMQNLKAVMEYEYTVKIREIKSQLREEYEVFLAEGVVFKDRNRYLEEEVRLLKLKYERSQKYNKQVQLLNEQKLQKQCQHFHTKIQQLQHETQSLKSSIQKSHQQQLKHQKITTQKQKNHILQLQQKLKQKQQKIQTLQKNIQQLNIEIKNKIVEKEELRIQKDRVIQEQGARIVVLREESVMGEVSRKREERDRRLREIDENVMREFMDSERKEYRTIDVFKTDMQKQILMEKEMKKRWQTQSYNKPQIRKVTNRKRSSTNDVSVSDTCSKRNSIVVDSPRFGIQTRLDLEFY